MKRSYDNFHKIDGSQMLTPDIDVEITYEDITAADSGVDQSGIYHRVVVRYDKRSWKFKYAVLTKEEFVYLRSLMKGKTSFNFTFLNELDKEETVQAYAKPVTIAYQSKRSGLYKNLTLEIIEC